MFRKIFDFSEFCFFGKLCVNFHCVARIEAEDTPCTIRLLAKFELPTRAANKTRLKQFTNVLSVTF